MNISEYLMVNVLFPSIVSKVTGEKRIRIEAKNISELIERLVEHYGKDFRGALFEESGELNRYLRIYVDGRPVEDVMKKDASLDENSNVAILVVISGG